MKNLSKLVIVSVLILSALSVSGYAEITKPYYVYSTNSEIRAMLAVKHNFGSVVSAELSSTQVQTLLSKGVYLQEVKIRHIDEVYCEGKCGLSSGKVYDGKLCYCDSYCTYAGDCCPDACQYCGYDCETIPLTTTSTTTTTVLPDSCTDSDGGINYYQYGYAEKSTSGRTDCCRIPTSGACIYNQVTSMIAEAYCDSYGEISAIYYTCPYGCLNGACISSSETTTTSTTVKTTTTTAPTTTTVKTTTTSTTTTTTPSTTTTTIPGTCKESACGACTYSAYSSWRFYSLVPTSSGAYPVCGCNYKYAEYCPNGCDPATGLCKSSSTTTSTTVKTTTTSTSTSTTATTVKTTTTTVKTTTTTYSTTTTTYSSGSYCSGMCGLKVNKPYNGYSYCYCTSYCKIFGNCCPDACQYCGYNCGTTTTSTTVKTTTTTVKTTTTTIKTTTTTVPSTGYCAGMCGQLVFKPYNGKSYCSCQSTCKTIGNCCPDACQYCGYNCGTTPTTTTTTVYVYRSCYPSSQKPWGITKVNGGSGGSGVTVAVLDTGVDTNHPDLSGNVKTCVTKVTHYALDSYSCEDAHGHGTHVAGSVAANGGADGKGIYGVAPQANLMIIKVCDRLGNCYSDDAAAGIRYAADNGANIISMSFSGPDFDPVERDAIDYAVNKGVLVVAAAGNTGPGANTIRYPAAYYKVVSVAAMDSLNNPASFSSRGINDGDFVREEGEIEFAAPGVSILSTYYDGCYATGEGTSQATPHIAGLAAKLWKGSESATRSYLKSVAKDIYTYGDDTATGFGLPVSP